MCESGSQVAGLDSGRLLAAFKEIGSFAGTAILHAEDESMIQANKRLLDAQGRKDYLAFTAWRPAEAEIEAIHRGLILLQDTGARAVFLHTTVPEGVEMVRQARARGQDVWVETCPHNLYLTEEHLAELGPYATYSPPVRSRARVEALWQQLEQGLIITMGSDHGPVDRKLKETGIDNIWKEQFGIPGAETMIPLMLHAVNENRITLERLVAILAENPARLYGLYPRKGVIQVGSDADFTIVDMTERWKIKAQEMNTTCKWTPYENLEIQGRVKATIVRGNPAMQDRQILVEPCFGRFYARNEISGPFIPA